MANLDNKVAPLIQKGWHVIFITNDTAILEKRVRIVPLWLTITLSIMTLGIGWPLISLFKRTKRMTVHADVPKRAELPDDFDIPDDRFLAGTAPSDLAKT